MIESRRVGAGNRDSDIGRGVVPRYDPLATHCINGHEYTEENTYHSPKDGRVCKICRREADKRRYARDAHRRRAPQTLTALLAEPAGTPTVTIQDPNGGLPTVYMDPNGGLPTAPTVSLPVKCRPAGNSSCLERAPSGLRWSSVIRLQAWSRSSLVDDWLSAGSSGRVAVESAGS
jgi:hypothetical protein